jgi:hypothetical protein
MENTEPEPERKQEVTPLTLPLQSGRGAGFSPWKGEIREGFFRQIDGVKPKRISLNPSFPKRETKTRFSPFGKRENKRGICPVAEEKNPLNPPFHKGGG